MELKEIIQGKQEIHNFKGNYIYFLLKDNVVVYVGQTTQGVQRIFAHCNDKVFDSFNMIECSKKKLDETEAYYITKFNPKYNIQLPNNDTYLSINQIKNNYRIDKRAINKIVKFYNLKKYMNDIYKKIEFEIAMEKAKQEGIIYKSECSTNVDWSVNIHFANEEILYNRASNCNLI